MLTKNKMAAIAAGVGLMVVCSSSLAAALMMGGEEKEDPVVPKTPKTPVVPTLPSGQYVKLVHTVAQDNSAAGNADDKIRSSTSLSLSFAKMVPPV